MYIIYFATHLSRKNRRGSMCGPWPILGNSNRCAYIVFTKEKLTYASTVNRSLRTGITTKALALFKKIVYLRLL